MRRGCSSTTPPATQSVLLVDDTSHLRELVRVLLEADGSWHIVGEAATGDEARRMAAEHMPDVIVLDNQMPGQSGLEALPALRTTCPSTRIVMWSSDSHLEREALRRGASYFVEKAQPLEHLINAMRCVAPD